MNASEITDGTNGTAPAAKSGNSEEEQSKPVKYGRGQNPNSIKQLIPMKPGQTINPKGKPKGTRDRATVLKEMMNVRVSITDPRNPLKTKKVTLYEAAALGMFLAAKHGNVAAFKEIQDTLHGPVPAKIEGHMEFSFAALAQAAAEEKQALPEYTEPEWKEAEVTGPAQVVQNEQGEVTDLEEGKN